MLFGDPTLVRFERELDGLRRDQHQNEEELRSLQTDYQADVRRLEDEFGRKRKDLDNKRTHILHQISSKETEISRHRDRLQEEYERERK